MTLLNNIPALIKVGAVFGLMMFGIRKKLPLGHAFLIGAVLLGLLFNQRPTAIFKSIIGAVTDPKTLALAVIVGLILLLSTSMETAGQMQRLLSKFRGLVVSPRLNLIVFPALIGLLPMPGGAVFSAPMVKELGAGSNLKGEQLSFINYWFRHIWEYWWPLYPGVLLGTLMADLNLMLFIFCMMPLTWVAIYLGGRPVRAVTFGTSNKEIPERPPFGPFIKELLPILIVIIPGVGLGMLFALIFPGLSISKEIGLIPSLFGAIGWIWQTNGFSAARIKEVLKNLQGIKMVYMIFTILIFKSILSDSHAVGAIGSELTLLKVPLFLIAITLPFIAGVVTGITIAVVGSTFPILIPLIHSHGQSQFMLAFIMLALVSGFAGVLLSPLHLCMILSNQYFKAAAGAMYRLLWRPCVYLVVLSMAYFWLLHGLESVL